MFGDNMEKYDVKFKKRFGQNFLKDINIVRKIVNVADIDNNSLVIEVGPGGGVMTKELALVAKNVLAYEVDLELKEELEKRVGSCENVEVKFKDFLEANIKDDIEKYQYDKLFFVSNVPYYITTPILLKIIKSNLNFDKVVMMVQKEVGERFASLPGRKEYGAITVLLNYYYDIKLEFKVSRKQFIPEPNVDSVVVSFVPKKERLEVKDVTYFEKIVRDSFQFKRKTIRNNLKNYNIEIVEEVLEKFGYDLNVRAENLEYEVFVELANQLYS